MVGLIHNSLGTLWLFLYHLEEENVSVGTVLMLLTIAYMFVSGFFFVNSGSTTAFQDNPTAHQIVLTIVMNTISIFVAIIGLIIFAAAFPVFESIGTEYIWSN
ncbi:membrane-spanning 4-domains subfamily A member 12-like isoform X1, partial [Sigmodon hispidus]